MIISDTQFPINEVQWHSELRQLKLRVRTIQSIRTGQTVRALKQLVLFESRWRHRPIRWVVKLLVFLEHATTANWSVRILVGFVRHSGLILQHTTVATWSLRILVGFVRLSSLILEHTMTTLCPYLFNIPFIIFLSVHPLCLAPSDHKSSLNSLLIKHPHTHRNIEYYCHYLIVDMRRM